MLIDLKSTSEIFAESMEVSVNGNEIVITVMQFYPLLILDGGNIFRTSRLYRT